MAKPLLAPLTLTSFCLALLVTPAQADPTDGGIYLRAFGGLSSLSDSDLTGAVTGTSGFDSGQIFGGAVGYAYPGSPFRAELEFAYRTGDADGAAGVTGDFASTALALNGYFDFAPVAGGRLQPYLGAGLVYLTEIDFDITGAAAGEYTDRGGSGYQLMVGATYPISESWSVTAELRSIDMGRQSLTGPGGVLNADYDALDVIIGTTFQF